MSGRSYDIAKRCLDLLVASLGLVILSPLLAMVAISIRLDTPGPILYRGVRSGLNGRQFHVWKFRSMVVDSEATASSTAKNDPRVTRVGAWIRRWKIDEVPELINVLKGEMSLVGPRPEVPKYTAQYRGDEELILTVLPGITDYSSLRFIQLADVLGEGDPDELFERQVLHIKNQLRVQYVKERSFWVDLTLIVRTLARLCFGR